MRTITAELDAAFRAAIVAALGFEEDPVIVPSANEKFGDYQANVVMGLTRQLSARTEEKLKPRWVAEQIVGKLQLGGIASEVSIAGPGFINVRLAPGWLAGKLKEARKEGATMGVGASGRAETVVVDYSGPNVAKEMHVGHLRSTIIGDAISRVIELQGNKVVRQNHIGDWGTQFGMLIAYLQQQRSDENMALLSSAVKELDRDVFHVAINDLEAFYRMAKQRFDESADFQKTAREAVVKLQGGDASALAIWKEIVAETRRHYQPIYQRLNVLLQESDERGESFYNPRLAGVVKDLKEKGLAKESEGAIVVETEGFENPLIVEKTGGGYLYATTDLAAIRYRVSEVGANRVIYTHDSRQAQHFAQVFQTARRAGWADGVSLEYAPFGTMLGEDGKPFKTRSGGTVKLKDLLDEAEERAFGVVNEKNAELPESQRRDIARAVGIGAVKYADLSKDRTSDYVFSWDKMLAMDGNTAPYLQYAYARIKSIFRRAGERGIAYDANAEVRLESPFEMGLAKHILRLPEVVELVGRELKPHHLCNYLYELATRFSGFFENCPVIQSEEPVRGSRLVLCDLTARTMGVGLELLGIEHPEQM